MEKIRIGSIGIGNVNRAVHLPGIAKSPDLELAAVCDIRPEALEYAQKTYGVAPEYCFTDYHELLACPLVDAVDIATPNYLHFEIAMAAVAAGKPYSVEKPMTMDAAQAEILEKATKEAGLKSMVCFSYRYRAAARYARDLIRQGVLGKLYHIDMQYYQAWGLPRFNTPRVWRFEKALTGSGALGDLGSHGLDLIRFVSGQEITRLTGHTGTFTAARRSLQGEGMEPVDVDDFSNCMGELSDGAAMTMRITRFGYGRGNYQVMEIYGEKGAMTYSLDISGKGMDKLEVCLDPLGYENHLFTEVPVPARYHMDQMQSFANLLLDKGDGLTASVCDGRINMRTVDAMLASAQDGAWKELP